MPDESPVQHLKVQKPLYIISSWRQNLFQAITLSIVSAKLKSLSTRIQLLRRQICERYYGALLEKKFQSTLSDILKFNYNITYLQIKLGLSQMSNIDNFILKRLKLAEHNSEMIKNFKYQSRQSRQTFWHLHIVYVDFNKIKKVNNDAFSQSLNYYREMMRLPLCYDLMT